MGDPGGNSARVSCRKGEAVTTEQFETLRRTPILFLDIDGVLNGHGYNPESLSCSIDTRCVACLNHILKQTDAMIVISSAWRYMILGGAMTLTGFDYMLRTHGVIASRVAGHTLSDEELPKRGCQIDEWLWRHSHVGPYCILDDGDPNEYGFVGRNHVHTDGTTGLVIGDATKAITFLQKG